VPAFRKAGGGAGLAEESAGSGFYVAASVTIHRASLWHFQSVFASIAKESLARRQASS
jgi:hypothetical protein